MAIPATIHRATIELSDVDRSLYQRLEATVARHPSETAERMVRRFLANGLCYSEDLSFKKGICAGDEQRHRLVSHDHRRDALSYCWRGDDLIAIEDGPGKAVRMWGWTT